MATGGLEPSGNAFVLTFQSTSVAGCRPVWPGWLRSIQVRLASRCAPPCLPLSLSGGVRIPSAPRIAFTRGRQLSEVYQSQKHSHLRNSMRLTQCMAIWMQMSLVDYSDVEETSAAPARLVKLLGAVRRILTAFDVRARKVATFSPCVSNFLNFGRWRVPPGWSPACVGTHLWSEHLE